MHKLKMRELRPELAPEAPHAEVVAPDVRIMEHDDRAIRQLGAPGPEILGDRVVGVQPVDVQQVDLAIAEVRQGLGERRAQQGGEAPVAAVVQLRDAEIYRFIVVSGVLIAAPCVHGVASRAGRQSVGGLAERGIGDRAFRAQLHKAGWAEDFHQPEGERHMLEPGAERQVLGIPVDFRSYVQSIRED